MLRSTAIAALVLTLGYFALGHTQNTVREIPTADIGALIGNPHKYDGQSVVVQGFVVDAVGVFGRGAYRLRQRDGYAEILVLTTRGVPPEHAAVTVHGQFRQALVLRDEQYAVIIESAENATTN